MAEVNDDPKPITYEDYYCMMLAHKCECLALTPEEWRKVVPA